VHVEPHSHGSRSWEGIWVSEGFDRRAFLRRSAVGAAGVALLGGAPALLAACGSSSSKSTNTTAGGGGSTAASKDFGTLDYQFSWIKNSEFAGSYLADNKGYYKSSGFSKVNLIAGGPNVAQDAVVQSGKAFIGISACDTASQAILKNGATLKAVGAQYQKNPFCIMSPADKPIKTPQDMVGKKIGVQAVNEPIWESFLKANNLTDSQVHKVTVQFDPTPLTQGVVDGWFSFITNEPNLLKYGNNFDTYNFLLNDFGYPLVAEIYIVKQESISSSRDKIKAALVADIKGWQDVLRDPQTAADLTCNVYGKENKLAVPEQKLEIVAENKLIWTDDTRANGAFTVTDQLVDESLATLAKGGISITKDKLFDLSLINEVYQEHPELKTAPA
jgi:ABC-type nitrate/sulfonate/bicarbonate transport system substrate-binding protein